ncbi:DNA photolyase family protein [Ancylomarina sp. DW003]|nr:deoxyribodipyrimidine photo-lyase [Ancylomarina sp. DW003]MDE5421369.1 DNA photolyase family protein [Ancylomarina sp. DW003]
MKKQKVSIFWFRRDLRLEDNRGLFEALKSSSPVLPLFIFDTNIINELEPDDSRISFIHDRLSVISDKLKSINSSLYCKKGSPETIWKNIFKDFDVQDVYANEDYEPYAIQRDKNIELLLTNYGVKLNLYKDQVIFCKEEILKADKTPYTVFTPYKNKWLKRFSEEQIHNYSSESGANFLKENFPLPSLSNLGFKRSSIKVVNYKLDHLVDYEKNRNIPALNRTSYLSPHLRFGTVSIRQVVQKTFTNQAFLNELIWRDFFMQILFNFPNVVQSNFRSKYDHIEWRNNLEEFGKWKDGETGYPMVDAGMRELNATGYMHNRVRMVVAGFLCKHLLIDWRWGEAYFASKLLDYELSSNNGNWQWSAGTGCDAAPYFRIFNPSEQVKKFDPDLEYIKKWVPEINSIEYPIPIVEHKFARERAIKTYKEGIEQYNKS